MSKVLHQFDTWLSEDGPAALVIREHLMPVEGRDGVVFPPTYAEEQGNDADRFTGGYNIDTLADGSKVCLIDSIGAQANRVEPRFASERYRGLVPQVVITAGEYRVNLLEAGHRAGDAIVRCTALQSILHDAFRAHQRSNSEPLAKVSPTSLVFGVWDSRDTQAKAPRLVGSTIRAYGVTELTRAAQYNPPVNYSEIDVFSDDEKKKAEGDKKSPLAKRGFVHVPATGVPGGIIATGGIRRDASLNLAALRLTRVGRDDAGALGLRRYLLGLSLVAFTHPNAFVGYLRQGCTLVLDAESKPTARECSLMLPSGKKEPVALTHEGAEEYAKAAAQAFGVGEDREVAFDKKLAKSDIAAKDK